VVKVASRKIVLKPATDENDEDRAFQTATAACLFLKCGKSQFYTNMRSGAPFKGWYIVDEGKTALPETAPALPYKRPCAADYKPKRQSTRPTPPPAAHVTLEPELVIFTATTPTKPAPTKPVHAKQPAAKRPADAPKSVKFNTPTSGSKDAEPSHKRRRTSPPAHDQDDTGTLNTSSSSTGSTGRTPINNPTKSAVQVKSEPEPTHIAPRGEGESGGGGGGGEKAPSEAEAVVVDTEPPKIQLQPTDVTVYSGPHSQAVFFCDAVSEGKCTYQWEQGGRVLKEGKLSDGRDSVRGVTSQTLIIKNCRSDGSKIRNVRSVIFGGSLCWGSAFLQLPLASMGVVANRMLRSVLPQYTRASPPHLFGWLPPRLVLDIRHTSPPAPSLPLAHGIAPKQASWI
jgi:hypothetical protein